MYVNTFLISPVKIPKVPFLFLIQQKQTSVLMSWMNEFPVCDVKKRFCFQRNS